MKWPAVSLTFLVLFGCANNTVEHVEQPDSVVKYQENLTDPVRFANLYPGKKTYPTTCTENCYPPSPLLACESPAENCRFTGQQTPPLLNTGFNIRWLGHASFYIENPDGTSLLFDPVSDQFDWPVNWAFRLSEGFNRRQGTWPTESEITNTDAVLYSHIHYDHFNKDDIAQVGSKAEYFVPLGFAEHFPQDGYRINEMTWFSSKSLGELNIHFVPAHHFSSRIWVPFLYEDNNTALWGGWVIEHRGQRLFFAGDTGYSQHFSDIQKKYGDMDVCLLPIASYFHEQDGEWYRYVHTTPEDALTAAQELNCKVMIPWGYGNASWKMGDHSSHSALLRLLNMHQEMKSDIPLHILNEGEAVVL
ncbi:MBL fold metallo-hydrolase [Thalassomonas haliotis]|uniref:MBL fold metallo-hydrolase n=1 Tax=Thalassomonas haliotis TaxID=485448 RepID=A0ABY7VGY0_9GAMM|nr:MBL fold metallo-hydrolase [Thalassomonas haliotis]WDE12188.1 MBL fold metallo-hydrolase [Thalassomonas haliotis]